jgi:hypothetical protein
MQYLLRDELGIPVSYAQLSRDEPGLPMTIDSLFN